MKRSSWGKEFKEGNKLLIAALCFIFAAGTGVGFFVFWQFIYEAPVALALQETDMAEVVPPANEIYEDFRPTPDLPFDLPSDLPISYPFPGENISRESDNIPAVRFIQNTLNLLRVNFTSIRIIETATGTYGGQTVGAVIDFQLRVGITPTGIVDEETWYKMVYALNNPPSIPDPPFAPKVDAKYVLLSDVNLRGRPTVESESLGIIPLGAVVYVLGFYPEDNWVRVWYNSPEGEIGFMRAEFLLLYDIFLSVPTALPISARMPTAPIQQISPRGRQAAEEFLKDFWTLFYFVDAWHNPETGGFYSICRQTWQTVESDGTVPFYWGGTPDTEWPHVNYDGRIFDSEGNQLTDLPFVRGNGMRFPPIAIQFNMFDLNSDGIPEIIITFLPVRPGFEGCLQGFAGETVVYKYINGRFQEIGNLLYHVYQLYVDIYGQIIILHNDRLSGVLFGYYYLHLMNNSIWLEYIISPSDDFESWWQHHSWPYFNESPTIYEIGRPLAAINPLLDLQGEIRDAIRQ